MLHFVSRKAFFWLCILTLHTNWLVSDLAYALIPPCPGGRFDFSGFALIGPGTEDAIFLSGPSASTNSGCAVTEARIRGGKNWTTVTARWESCSGIVGRARLRAKIDTATCNTMVGRFIATKAKLRRDFIASRNQSENCNAAGVDTYTELQNKIFNGRGCTLATCHSSFAAGGLDLRPGTSHLNLIEILAANGTAASAGKVRVKPGDPNRSFLLQKLTGNLLAGEGSRMPNIGQPLPAVEIAALSAWIAAGAPATGQVASAPCIPEPPYEPVPAPAPPAGGYQIVLNGPWLAPGQEMEGCLWVQSPNTAPFRVKQWEFALNPGTHHFSVMPWARSGAPTTGVWSQDIACISGSDSATMGQAISGSPQAPYYIHTYPEGVARELSPGQYLGLNAHYHNGYNVPIQIKAYINILPELDPPSHTARTLLDFNDMFSIYVPPFSLGAQNGSYVNSTTQTQMIYSLTGHMHKRGLRFTATSQSGSLLYENLDWAHPIPRPFTPPLALPPGGRIDYRCEYDNGITRPVREDAQGLPTAVRFGVTSDDEMCTLNGEYYNG